MQMQEKHGRVTEKLKFPRQLRSSEEGDGDGSSHADERAKDLSPAAYFSDVHSLLPDDEFNFMHGLMKH